MIEIGGDNINSVQADMRVFLNESGNQLTLFPNRCFNKPDYFAFGVAFCADYMNHTSWNTLMISYQHLTATMVDYHTQCMCGQVIHDCR